MSQTEKREIHYKELLKNIENKKRQIKEHSNKARKLGLVSSVEYHKKHNILQMKRNLVKTEKMVKNIQAEVRKSYLNKKMIESQKGLRKKREFTPSKSKLGNKPKPKKTANPPTVPKKTSKPKKIIKGFAVLFNNLNMSN